MFTSQQYDNAIQALHDAKKQLAPDGRDCAICGHCDHQAFECGHNPLLAMFICTQIAATSHQLHEQLHYLAGFDSRMGVQVGPTKVVMPTGE